MQNYIKFVFKYILAGTVFALSAILTSIIVVKAWNWLNATSWDTLTAAKWNELVDKIAGVTTSGGNVGIGTDTPVDSLHVVGNINVDGIKGPNAFTIQHESGASPTSEMFFKSNANMEFTIDSDNSSADRSFRFLKDNGEEIFKIQENGRVVVVPITEPNRWVELNYAMPNDYGSIQAYDRTASTYKMLHVEWSPVVINEFGGRVGIGTSSPLSKLEIIKPIINKDYSVAESHIFARWSDNGYGLAMGVLNNPAGGFLQSMLNNQPAPGGTSIPLYLNPGGGNVGIGSTSAWAKLDVNGGMMLKSMDATNKCLIEIYNNGCPTWYAQIGTEQGIELCLDCNY